MTALNDHLKRLKYQAGFTLFESLLVLTIFGVLLIILPNQPLRHVQESIEGRQFFNQLKSYVNLAQYTAIIQGTTVSVQFSPQQNLIYTQTNASLLVDLPPLNLPSNWSVNTSFRLTYLPNGHIGHFKTIYFSHPKFGLVQFVPHLGSGRYEIRH